MGELDQGADPRETFLGIFHWSAGLIIPRMRFAREAWTGEKNRAGRSRTADPLHPKQVR
jgi:hypothetical protein